MAQTKARVAIRLCVPVALAELFERAAKDGALGSPCSIDDVYEHVLRDSLFRDWLRLHREMPMLREHISTDSAAFNAAVAAGDVIGQDFGKSAKVSAAKAKGGNARAAKLPAARRTEIARKAAKKRWKK